jgi:hypothetical protein
VGLLGLLAACGDEAQKTDPDAAPPDKSLPTPDKDNSNLPDGYKLWPCDEPGKACNAHDPCALNPICGPDKKCRPTTLMDCSDNLDCTTDICAGSGVCKNEPKKGWCVLGVTTGTPDAGTPDAGAVDASAADASLTPYATEFKCFAKGSRKPGDPCSACDPVEHDGGTTNNTRWSPVNGGTCNDGNSCTRDDTCVSGTCKGTYFGDLCSDGFGCTDDICDGKGGCLGNKLKSDWCLIGGTCYKKNTPHPSGSCMTCDPSVSQSSWTAITNTCIIDSKCYSKGAKHPGGCAECNPTISTTKWTVNVTTDCLIANTCKKKGDKHDSGCAECDPAKDKYNWTMLSGPCQKCNIFIGSEAVGKECTSTSTTDCPSGYLCLLTATIGGVQKGVCTKDCTLDNPSTSTNEDNCPDLKNNQCVGVPLVGGTTRNFCLRRCLPRLGCNECSKNTFCYPGSGAYLGAPNRALCLYYKASAACAKDADCNVTTGTKCNYTLSNCPTGQTCLLYANSSTVSNDGICAKPGKCDVLSGLCKPHTQGTTGAKIGDPCKGDTDCANGMDCAIEYDETKYRKSYLSTCTYNSDCCSGTCTSGLCAAGPCDVNYRNGYCTIYGCTFASSLTHAACPGGSACNLLYSTGMCQKTCDPLKAATCRGHANDKFGDYECRSWNNITHSILGKISPSPLCEQGAGLHCSGTKSGTYISSCAALGPSGNSTKMSCRDTSNKVLTNQYDPSGRCLDDTPSAPVSTADGGVPPG